MKKIPVVLIVITMMGMMSCENSKKNDAGAGDKAVAEEVIPAAATPEKSKVVIVARAVVKEEQVTAFTDVAKVLVEATRKEPGCLFYSLYQSPSDPQSFLFYEEYKDEPAFAAHSSSDHFKTFAGTIGDMLAEELIIDRFQSNR
jgi:quinol monooxygenase YgiN